MAGLSTKILDHIPHLTPPGTLDDSAEAFRKLGFTVVPGGTHAGGATANALVVFADGTYLELIHFVQPPPADSPDPWSRKRPGWIDYAFLGSGVTGEGSIARAINARAEKAGSLVHYNEAPGGRKREDGKVLKWVVSSVEEKERGKLPFFCGDVTPREWRVPTEPESYTKHANTALGIAYIRLLVTSDEFVVASKQLTVILGASPGSSSPTQAVWDLDEQPTSNPGIHETAPKLILATAQKEEELTYVDERGPGIYEVGFVVSQEDKVGSATTPFGRIVWKTASDFTPRGA